MTTRLRNRFAISLAAGLAFCVIALSAHRPATGQDADQLIITGTVTSDAGSPLIGAQISIVDMTVGAVTDDAGRYVLRLERESIAGDSIDIDASFIGYETGTRRVAVAADTLRVNFQLAIALLSLDKVVVSGVGEGARAVRPPFAVSKAAEPPAGASPAQRASQQQQRGQGSLRTVDALQYRIAGAAIRARDEREGASNKNFRYDPDFNTESYDRIYENPFLAADDNPLSTFSIDVDRASYGNVRRFVENGQRPPADAVRIEELINYFSYDDPDPRGRHPFAVRTEVARAPWHPEHMLLRVGLQTRRIDTDELPPANLVFLLDVSGSMAADNKLPLLKRSLAMLVEQLREQDRVAIVVYAGAAGLVLPPTPGSEKRTILAALDRLQAGGSTAGGAGIRLAYDVARRYHHRNGNNRVILATDGDFNIGVSSDAEMVRLIEEKREQGTFLTVLGFGTGNLKDSKMEKLADSGNGNYAYIDGLAEARKTLVHEIGGTLLTVAKDVKLQIEFNPAAVAAYRLIGYENRLLRAEDFDDDAKDAGEIGAGHAVTALYELIPVGVESDTEVRGLEPLRYQRSESRTATSREAEIGYIKLRYKQPDRDTSILFDHVIEADPRAQPSADFTFASAVAAFGLILRESEHRGNASIDQVIALANDGIGEDPEGYRRDFVDLARTVRDAHWFRTITDADGDRRDGSSR